MAFLSNLKLNTFTTAELEDLSAQIHVELLERDNFGNVEQAKLDTEGRARLLTNNCACNRCFPPEQDNRNQDVEKPQ